MVMILTDILTALIEFGAINILIILFVLAVLMQLGEQIYDANFKKEDPVANKNLTGMFHPSPELKKQMEDNLVKENLISSSRKKDLWLNPIGENLAIGYDSVNDSYSFHQMMDKLPKRCFNCQEEIEDEDIFCGYCGEQIV